MKPLKDIVRHILQSKKTTSSKSDQAIEKSGVSHRKTPDKPILINTSSAKIIHLPAGQINGQTQQRTRAKQDWNIYWKIFGDAMILYNKGDYVNAKDEFVKIYDWYHGSNNYHEKLLQTYRKLIQKFISGKQYMEALSESSEMLAKCRNITTTDIRRYNKLVDQLKKMDPGLEISKRELPTNIISKYHCDSQCISYIMECKKPKHLDLPESGEMSILKLRRLSDFLPTSLPYIIFENSKVEYTQPQQIPCLKHEVYRLRESPARNAFIVSSRDSILNVYDWNLKLLHSLDVSQYIEEQSHLRMVDVSSDLSSFLFTNIDKVYLLDAAFKIVSAWCVPGREGAEKVKVEHDFDTSDKTAMKTKQYLDLLGLDSDSTKEEIGSAYRHLAFQYHPDRSPDHPYATEKMQRLNEAYEFLTGEEAQKAFRGLEDEEYWVKTISKFKVEIAGTDYEFEISMGGLLGGDWIYGTGISNDGAIIYLGCYSGKVYQIDRNGEASKIFVSPSDRETIGELANPVLYIIECGDYLHILTELYLYILRDDKIIKSIMVSESKIKWFDTGFTHYRKGDVTVYKNNGDILGSMHFNNNVRQICYRNKHLVVETSKELFLFELKAE